MASRGRGVCSLCAAEIVTMPPTLRIFGIPCPATLTSLNKGTQATGTMRRTVIDPEAKPAPSPRAIWLARIENQLLRRKVA